MGHPCYRYCRRLRLEIEEALDASYWESLDQVMARGEVIDENALTRMLRASEIAGVGLDAFERGCEINPGLQLLSSAIPLRYIGVRLMKVA